MKRWLGQSHLSCPGPVGVGSLQVSAPGAHSSPSLVWLAGGSVASVMPEGSQRCVALVRLWTASTQCGGPRRSPNHLLCRHISTEPNSEWTDQQSHMMRWVGNPDATREWSGAGWMEQKSQENSVCTLDSFAVCPA